VRTTCLSPPCCRISVKAGGIIALCPVFLTEFLDDKTAVELASAASEEGNTEHVSALCRETPSKSELHVDAQMTSKFTTESLVAAAIEI